MIAWSWRASPPPAVFRVQLGTGDPPPVTSLTPADMHTVPPGVVSVAFAAPRIKTVGFKFPDPFGALPPAPPPTPASTDAPLHELASFTRIRPPSDLVKLEDRLYYVLQPPLEAVLADQALEFPCRPFPYQFEGIAFLYPRAAAVLADEMGLGKTMQAITAMRLLLHARQVRNILLICPKPLVSNWEREFQRWAPEVPVTIIEGDATKRRWQWRLNPMIV